ncbi:MAG TPA: putative porin, partial [Methylomirabilota bacterium]|nr:putative porin [Methylomirabilota bacterium]
RLTSSERADNFGGDPISGNTTFQDNGSKKFIFLDLAYAKWAAINTPDMTGVISLGKIENPFVFSDMVFDGDYTPEGLSQQFAYTLNDAHGLKLNLGEFVLDEIGGRDDDPYLFGAQLRFDSTWNKHVATSFGVAGLVITDDDRLTTSLPAAGAATSDVPNINAGNEHTGSPAPLPAPAGTATTASLAHNFNPLVVDGAVTYTLESFPMYNAAFPIRLGADYMYNPGAEDQNMGYSVGLTLGKSGKRRLWEVGYRWKELQANAWWEELVDSDFGAYYGGNSAFNPGRGAGYQSGTNIRGHILKASYSPTDSLTLGATGFITEVINEVPAGSESDMLRVQLDAVWKF